MKPLADNIFVVDSGNHRIRRIDRESGNIKTVATQRWTRFAKTRSGFNSLEASPESILPGSVWP